MILAGCRGAIDNFEIESFQTKFVDLFMKESFIFMSLGSRINKIVCC